MLVYLLLLPILYLAVGYITIFKMNTTFSRILRIIMAILLLFVCAFTTVYYNSSAWWAFVVLLMLVANVEVTGFKQLKKDQKGVAILNGITVMVGIIYIILAIVLYR